MKIVYAFDVDETLEVSNGPIKIQDMKDLKSWGHIVGICGNWSYFVSKVPDWHTFCSFIGHYYIPRTESWVMKSDFLLQIKNHVPADAYVMVGNDPAHYGHSDDIGAAREANWIFIREDQFHLNDVHVKESNSHNINCKLNIANLILEDFDFIFVGCHDKNGKELFRQDISKNDLNNILTNKGSSEINWNLQFNSNDAPHSYTFWTHSVINGWLDKFDTVIGK